MVANPTRSLSRDAVLAMRAVPPEATLGWLLGELQATRVVDVEPMRGSSTSALHRVTLRFSDGDQTRVVLRRYVLEEVIEENHNIVAQEINALRVAALASVPTPGLLAADIDAKRTDTPAVVMSWLEGRPRWEAKNRRRFLADLVDAMTAVAAVEVPSDVHLRSIRGYTQVSYDPPLWATKPRMWERAVEIFQGPVPDSDISFVHRDFHPGNVLWSRSKLTGLVDWQSAGIGPVSIDPGHCRLNMLYYDPAMADQLRSLWEQQAQRTYDPWADVTAIIGVLDSLRSTKNPSRSHLAIEDTLTRAVADLTG